MNVIHFLKKGQEEKSLDALVASGELQVCQPLLSPWEGGGATDSRKYLQTYKGQEGN